MIGTFTHNGTLYYKSCRYRNHECRLLWFCPNGEAWIEVTETGEQFKEGNWLGVKFEDLETVVCTKLIAV